jgi:prevent-host-death family protein
MVDTSVGVRELKQAAPRLVKRAERGERIVITRRGVAAAVLGPAPREDQGATPGSRLWSKERAAFQRLLPRLERRYDGKYVAVSRGRVVGADFDHDRLFERTFKRLRGRVFFIGRVGAPPPVIDMPGFDLDSE